MLAVWAVILGPGTIGLCQSEKRLVQRGKVVDFAGAVKGRASDKSSCYSRFNSGVDSTQILKFLRVVGELNAFCEPKGEPL